MAYQAAPTKAIISAREPEGLKCALRYLTKAGAGHWSDVREAVIPYI
jgi:hypothetical protein